MRSSPLARLALLSLASLGVLPACAYDSDGGAPASESSDVKKRVHPSSGVAAFELKQPAWWDASSFTRFEDRSGRALRFGQRIEAPAGPFLVRGPSFSRFGFDGSESGSQIEVPLQLGFVSVYEPAGLVVRYAKPVNDGTNWLTARRADRHALGLDASLLRKGIAVTLFDGPYELRTGAGEAQSFTLAEGERREIVLPVADLDVAFDGLDAEYPGGGCVSLRAEVAGTHPGSYDAASFVPKRDASHFTLPAGANARLVVEGCGIPRERELPLGPAAAHTLTVHRLEVDDVEVAQPSGGTKKVRGTFHLARKKPDGTYARILEAPTHTGVDVVDGTYRVTSVAGTAAPHVTEVTFP